MPTLFALALSTHRSTSSISARSPTPKRRAKSSARCTCWGGSARPWRWLTASSSWRATNGPSSPAHRWWRMAAWQTSSTPPPGSSRTSKALTLRLTQFGERCTEKRGVWWIVSTIHPIRKTIIGDILRGKVILDRKTGKVKKETVHGTKIIER